MRRLPPFAPLVAFEAVVRLGSFTRAAAELGLTQSAVSHRVRGLERHLGSALIERLNPGLRVTPAGAALMPRLTEALELLAGIDARATGSRGVPPLRLGVGAALATWWLARRLPLLRARAPGIAIELVPFENADEADRADVDLRVLWVGAAEAGETKTQRPLFRETVFPVCRPSLLPAGRAVASPAALRALPLIHKGSADDGSGEEWRWSSWLGGGRGHATPAPALRVREIGQALAAAVEGGGVALGRSLLVHDAIADGRLVRALPVERRMICGKVHVARWSRALIGDRRVATVVGWLAAEAERAVSAADRPTTASAA